VRLSRKGFGDAGAGQEIETVEQPGMHVKLGGHAGAEKTLRIRDVLVEEEVERTDLEERGR